MKRFNIILSSIITSFSLILFCMVPALASTTYSTRSQSYSTRVIYYHNGYYSTKPIYRPVPTQPQQPTPSVPSNPKPPTTTNPTPSQPSTGLDAEEAKMVNLVNQARMGQGVKPLSVNSQLTSLARKKSQDMVTNNYFSHTSPTYGSPFEMMKNAGITYNTAGENIAGAQSTESAHQNLMNSEGHRANILNSKFTEIGIGIASGSTYGKIFTQMFIGR